MNKKRPGDSPRALFASSDRLLASDLLNVLKRFGVLLAATHPGFRSHSPEQWRLSITGLSAWRGEGAIGDVVEADGEQLVFDQLSISI